MTIDFNSVLSAALTPVALISGIGMLLLSMTNRYAHATNRVRELLAEKEHHGKIDPEIDKSIELIFRRAWYLRRGIFSIMLSATMSGLIVMANIIEQISGLHLVYLKTLLLLAGMGLLVISTIYFVLEVHTSLHALDLTVHPHLKNDRRDGS